MLVSERRKGHVDAGTAEDAVIPLLHFAMADEIETGGVFGKLCFHNRGWMRTLHGGAFRRNR